MRELLTLLVMSAGLALADEPVQSGLRVGQRPGPYSAIISTGKERGQSVCYVCETGDRPAVIVFARSLSGPLGKLVHDLDQARTRFKESELRAWLTVLGADQAALDARLVEWGRAHAIGIIPLGVFEDPNGPPSYRLSADADVTVLLCVKQKVVAKFVFRAGELTVDRVEEILKALPTIGVGK